MASYQIAIKKLLEKEGGFVNDPQDTGGMTYKGISRNNFPNYDIWKYVDEILTSCTTRDCINSKLDSHPLVQELVTKFYLDNFWNILKLTQIDSQPLAELIFEIGVHSGSRTGGNLLQEACNNLQGSHRYAVWNDLTVDGKIGPNTIKVVSKIIETRSVDILMIEIKLLQAIRYKSIIKNRPGNKKFYAGWLRRLF